MSRFLLVVLIPVTVAGCSTIGQRFRENCLARASFEMRCPAEELEIEGLNVNLDAYISGRAQVGVSGCGKRAVYVQTTVG